MTKITHEIARTMIPKRKRRVQKSEPITHPKEDPNAVLLKPISLPAYAIELFQPHRYKVLWGGRGATRSWSVARTLLMMGAAKKLRILCAREIQASLSDSVHQLLRDQIDLMEIPGYTVTDREIRHRNGTIFIFAGLRHNVTKIKSMEGIDICWVEEAERITKHSWSMLIPTIRKAGSEIWVTFNPDQESDATYQRFIIHPPKDTWAKKVSSHDNPWLSPELLEERTYAYATDPEAADHVWGGNIRTISEAQVLKGKWRVEEFHIPRDDDGNVIGAGWNGPYLGTDFGFGVDPFATIKLWVKDRVLYVEEEVYKHSLEIDDAPDLMIATIPECASYTVRADSARPDSISYLRKHGIPRIIGAKKGPGSVEDGIAHLRSYVAIIAHPRCIHTIDECKMYSYKVDKMSGDVLPVLVDKHNHLIDCARYALEPMIKPKRRAGFIFVSQDGNALCGACESRLPDDGVCPHCGWTKDEHIAEDAVPIPVDAVDLTVAVSHTNGNGNGHTHAETNGSGNGNGHSPHPESVITPPRPRLRMRDLNS